MTKWMIVLSSFMLCGFVSCKTNSGASSTGSAELKSAPGSSTYLSDAGETAKKYVYSLIEKRNEAVKVSGGTFKFVIMDARDPRLYAPGSAIQPPSPADKALVKVANDGRYMILALIVDRPGLFVAKEFPTGNKIFDIEYPVQKVAYSSRFDGLFGSVTRNTSGNGWTYVYYLRGYDNFSVTPAMFDAAIATFLQNGVLYMTPVGAGDPGINSFAPKKQ